ncbi:MAG: L-threonylcarbamoyladenylate synthase [Solirubrobacteraceae bacterium]
MADDVLPLDPVDIARLTAVTAAGGIVLFPAEGVYGLAADPRRPDAVARLAALKHRDPTKPVAVLFWSVDDALAGRAARSTTGQPAVGAANESRPQGDVTVAGPSSASPAPRAADEDPGPTGGEERLAVAVRALLPGPVGLLVPDPSARFPAAAGPDPTTLGIRVPCLDGVAPPGTPPIAQTSANRAGDPDPTTVDAVPAEIRDECDLVLDRGARPGIPSTIVDLREWTRGDGPWRVVREGTVPYAGIARRLGPQQPRGSTRG